MAPSSSHRIFFVFNGYIITTGNFHSIKTRTFMYKHRYETRYKYPPPTMECCQTGYFPL